MIGNICEFMGKSRARNEIFEKKNRQNKRKKYMCVLISEYI